MLRKCLFTILTMLSCVAVMAQDQPEYRMEIGGGIGLMTYQGDFNGAILSGENSAPSAMAVVRRVINPYSALRFNIGYGQIKGKSKDLQTFYPDFNTPQHQESARQDYKFSNTLIDLGATYEYNFLPYGTGRDYRGAKRLTPYITFGLGFTYVNSSKGVADLSGTNTLPEGGLFGAPEMGGSKGIFTANLPLGLGVKYKIADRLNLGLEWMVHFTLSDKLDGVKDPYRIKSNGIFKNTDGYTNLQVSLTYSFWEKCRTCHKDI